MQLEPDDSHEADTKFMEQVANLLLQRQFRKTAGRGQMISYKVTELSTVTDEEIEKAINSAVGEGWSLDGIHFAMREASKRPAMAFILFTKELVDQ